jgi:GrpB-like predicted nucleotidyltransferase (UPF0157 family)
MEPEDLEAVLIGGLEPATVTVVDYDTSWPERFEALAGRVGTALGVLALSIEHIGSTAVPGLAAKPIIDILVVVPDVEDEAAFVPPLETAGFVLRVREPGHRMMRTPSKDAHVHFHEPDDPAIQDHIDLRDWLRTHPDDRAVYAATKRDLARQQWEDMNYYAEAKSDVIDQIRARARH